MNVLFVHQNFPGQYRTLAPTLIARGDTVVAMTMNDFAGHPGMRHVKTRAKYSTATTGHPWSREFDTKVIRADASFRTALKLRDEGFEPDVILAHPGWGESLFLKVVWPKARLGIYCEFFYGADGGELNFDPEFPNASQDDTAARMLVKNAANYLQFPLADAGIAPTHWQAGNFPKSFRDRITVIHDGIDTKRVRPDPDVTLAIDDKLALSRADEVITFVNRNLEPYRGYHVFMRALPELLRRRPDAHVLIVGGNETSYGAAPPKGKTWKDIFLHEVAAELDLARVHFMGKIPYDKFLKMLQLSTVHVYLTYPFVLSWSLIEAMASACAIVASDVDPVREALTHREQGLLVPFFDRAALVDAVCSLLEDPARRAQLGRNARARAMSEYDLRSSCLPRQVAWVDALAAASPRALD